MRAGDVEVANSRQALLLAWYGPGRLPTYCLPPEDVRAELLGPSADGGEDGFVVDGVREERPRTPWSDPAGGLAQ